MRSVNVRSFDRLRLLAGLIGVATLIACGGLQPRDRSVAKAFQTNASNSPVEDEGVVTRILSDDKTGISHQRFIVRVASGQTVLIEHNIEIAPRVADLNVGDTVSFSGEYVWNDKGGLVHWTHHDPAGRHASGWLKHNGKLYQ